MIRIDERRDIVADLLTDVVRGSNKLIFKNWSSDRVIDVVGPDGVRYWVKYNGKQIKSDHDYKINPEETLPSSQGTKRLDAKEFIQLATSIPGADVQYLMGQYASTFDWLDPKLIYKNLSPGSGPGRSPEQPVLFGDLQQMMGGGGDSGAQKPGQNQFAPMLRNASS
jgi:hypothetical protein